MYFKSFIVITQFEETQTKALKSFVSANDMRTQTHNQD